MTSLAPATGTDPQPQSGTKLIENDPNKVGMEVDENGFTPSARTIYTGKPPKHVEFSRADTSKTYRCSIVKQDFKTQHFTLDDSTPTFVWPNEGESVDEGEYKTHVLAPSEHPGEGGRVGGDAGTIHVGS